VKRALSTVDGRDWNAVEFSSRDAAWQRSRRRGLVCLACGAPAFFRSSGRRRAPTFGARHKDGCALVSAAWSVFRYLQ